MFVLNCFCVVKQNNAGRTDSHNSGKGAVSENTNKSSSLYRTFCEGVMQFKYTLVHALTVTKSHSIPVAVAVSLDMCV